VGFAVGGPAGAAIGSGIGTKLSGGSTRDALISAGGSYVGGRFLGAGAGDVAGNMTQSSIPGLRGLGGRLASGTFGSLGSAIGAASFPGITGSLMGQSIARMAAGPQMMAPINEGAPTAQPTGPSNAPLPTSQPEAAALPSSLSQFSGLDPLQQLSGVATEGLYGGGTGAQEQNYFLNLLQRQLIGSQGGYQDYSTSVNPTTEAYLQNNLGLQFDPSTTSLLQAIANRNAAMG
jgi:hypothetical protein